MIVVPFLSVHLDGFQLQKSQKFMDDFMCKQYAQSLEKGGPGWSAMEDGECIACAGYMHIEPHKAITWALLSYKMTPRNFIKVHRAVKYEFDRIDAKRIELYIRGSKQEHRWAKALGMTLETPDGMPNFYFDGLTGYLYGKVVN